MDTRTVRIDEDIAVAVYRFPTEQIEADGTLEWDWTTAVVVRVGAGGEFGLGWTYGSPATAEVVSVHLAPHLGNKSPFDIAGCWETMHRACRNIGSKGIAALAISAVDIALWDLKARLLAVPLATLLGATRERVPVYGSGGFVNLHEDQLSEQVGGWLAAGCRAVKIKIGEGRGDCIERDLERVQQVRKLTGPDVRIMVDANGGYTRGQARRVGQELDRLGVVWFEEPVTSDDRTGLAAVRDAVRCDVAAGEYVYDGYDAAALVDVVDCLQLDVTRCGGYTGFLRGAAVAGAHGLDVSAHCAPSLHAPIAGAVTDLRHIEWFIDHVRLEPLLVDGVPEVSDGELAVPLDEPGHGMRIAAAAADYRLR
ncbi:mandelate racemase [Nocardia otitidiscaviarum]|uniref:enolase C-terminal domain-like protein n=1 Tax=Nocardia otitidiscaviarum TaxID=1823 RepID=UPI001894539F|nr:enolase C-terminal domain-like protein [Nocardia otitidiscaviarum]MBF6238839.1 mandelate racemase [Nocardia otitidiscaviarum]